VIADEYQNSIDTASLSNAEGTTIESIFQCMENTMPYFIIARTQPNIKKDLNENQLTQIFVEQAAIQIRNTSNTIGILNQYSDTFFGTKGVPDFYFYLFEEDKTHYPLFVVEAKRLPPPGHDKTREKEYVIGYNNNGGIERYKTEKHGIHLAAAGMLGFIEEETPSFWLTKINNWIIELSTKDQDWRNDEILNQKNEFKDYHILQSIAHRNSKAPDITLHHWWVVLAPLK
jgi:hypothetical protein